MKTDIFPVIYLARHGETAWSLTGQHTGFTDLPLTERGEQHAKRLGARLTGLAYVKVLTSPFQRVRANLRTGGVQCIAEIDRDLVEWNYGDNEGLRTVDIHAKRPDWNRFGTVALMENHRIR